MATAGVVEVRRATSSIICSWVNRPVRETIVPFGAITALTPTVEIWTVARPVSIARICDMASCWVDSAVGPKLALLVCTTSISAPAATESRTRPS